MTAISITAIVILMCLTSHPRNTTVDIKRDFDSNNDFSSRIDFEETDVYITEMSTSETEKNNSMTSIVKPSGNDTADIDMDKENKENIYEEDLNTNEDGCNYDELYILSHLIYGESSGCSDKMQLYVGSVVLNRVNSDEFPNSIEAVVFQSGQYACTWDGNYDKEPDEQAINNAKYLLENGSVLPEYVVFQAEFIQGEIYEQIGNTYFCY